MFAQTRRAATSWLLRTAVTTTVVVGTVELTTRLPSQGRSSAVYHVLADTVVTPLMQSSLPAETAHTVALMLATAGLAPTHCPSATEQRLTVSCALFGSGSNSSSSSSSSGSQEEGEDHQQQRVATLVFAHPVGLAAGWDKDGVAVAALLAAGCSHVEVGTVTPHPQPGNAAPRLFRLWADQALINRYGFNSQGAAVVRNNLQAFRQTTGAVASPPSTTESWREKWRHLQQLDSIMNWTAVMDLMGTWCRETILPALVAQRRRHEPPGIVGVNIGRNKNTHNDDVAQDYYRNIASLGPVADYLVINISSPNTKGLREWQDDAQKLESLLQVCSRARQEHCPHVPLLVKIAPDCDNAQIEQIAQTCQAAGIDGLVVANTSNQRPPSLLSPYRKEAGGLSGKPLATRSTECIRIAYAATRGKLPIIGVGGVSNGADVYEKLRAGASLVQVYTAMVYQGPGFISRIRHELAQHMLDNGHRSVQDVIGLDHEELFWKNREARILQHHKSSAVSSHHQTP